MRDPGDECTCDACAFPMHTMTFAEFQNGAMLISPGGLSNGQAVAYDPAIASYAIVPWMRVDATGCSYSFVLPITP